MLRHPHLLALPFLLLGCPGSPRKDAADTADTAPSTETANDDTAKECARQDWYADADGDGHGAGDAESACDAPAGTGSLGDDCDDTDPWVGETTAVKRGTLAERTPSASHDPPGSGLPGSVSALREGRPEDGAMERFGAR